MSLPCVSWHPSAKTFSYVRASSMSVCSEKMLDVVPLLRIVLPHFFRTLAIIVPCTIVGYAVPVRGNLFFPCSYCFLALHCLPSWYDSVCSPKVLKGYLCHFRSRSIISYHRTDGEILAWSLPFPSGEGFASSFRMSIFYSSSISAFKSFPSALMKQFLLCAPMPSVFMTFGYYGFCFIFPLQS